MAEENIKKLKALKKDLLKKAISLRDQLKREEGNKHKPQSLPHINIPETEEVINISENISDGYGHRLCEAMQHVTGIKFEDIDKSWLHDDVYIYKTSLVTKTINFYLELTVRTDGDKLLEIIDITCHFSEVDHCYMLEVTPWVALLTKMKSFEYFISAISDYSDYSIFRSKMLYKLQKKGYATLKECVEGTGGILTYVHSAKTNEIYLQFTWCMIFAEQTWHIEHYLTIAVTDIGKEFAEKYVDLLDSFCKLGLKHHNLEDLWTKLINAINEYEAQDIEQ